MLFLNDDLLTLIANKVSEKADRKSFSEVCKQWFTVEGLSRSSLTIYVDSFGFSYGALTRFPNLVHLKVLRVRTDVDLEFISHTCPKLESIIVDSNINPRIDPVFMGPKGLLALGKGCPRLSKVKLRGDMVEDSGVVALLHSAHNLKTLVLEFNKTIGVEALRAIGSSTSIRKLKLVYCDLKDVELGVLASGSSSSISILELVLCDSITDVGLGFLANGCISKTLKKLVLLRCNEISDSGVKLLRKMSSLEHLDLYYIGKRSITDIGIIEISAIQTLKELHLAGLDGVTDTSMVALAENCQNLETLDLRGCKYVTGAGIRSFSGHKCLKCIGLLDLPYNCFDEADLESIALGCPSMESIILNKWQFELVNDRNTRVVKFI